MLRDGLLAEPDHGGGRRRSGSGGRSRSNSGVRGGTSTKTRLLRLSLVLIFLGYGWGAWMTYEYFTSHGSSSGSPSGGGADPLRDVCDGEPPVVLGTYNFTGTRTTVAPSTGEPSAWLDGIVSKHIAGVEWCVWQDGVYFMLAVNSPAGLVRRLCAFNADMRSALCTGTDGTDGGVTEHVFVTAVEPRGDRYGGGDDDASGGCVATKLGITTCKPFVNDPATPVAQAFLDGEVVSVRTSDDVPSDPTHL